MLLDIKNYCEAQIVDHDQNRIESRNKPEYIGNLIYEVDGKRKVYLMNNSGNWQSI